MTIDGVVIRNGSVPRGTGSDIGGDAGSFARPATAAASWSSGGFTLTKSTISGSSAREGGALDIDAPTTIKQSTIIGNTASIDRRRRSPPTRRSTSRTARSPPTPHRAAAGCGAARPRPCARRRSPRTRRRLRAAASTATAAPSPSADRSSREQRHDGSRLLRQPDLLRHEHRADHDGLQPDGRHDPHGRPEARTARRQRRADADPTAAERAAPRSTPTHRRDARRVRHHGRPARSPRPQPTGGKCDVGARRGHARSASTSTLTTSPTRSRVGTGTVPFANIPPAALIPGARGNKPRPSSAYQALGVSSISADQLSAYQVLGVSSISAYQALGVSSSRRTAFSAYVRGGERASTRPASPIRSAAIPLTDVTLDLPGGWPAFLAGTQFDGVPAEHAHLRAGRSAARRAQHGSPSTRSTSVHPLGSLPYVALLPRRHAAAFDPAHAGARVPPATTQRASPPGAPR